MERSAMRKKAVPIALAFIALALLTAWLYSEHADSVTKMRDLTLRQDLFTMRAIVNQFTLDKHKRPQSFDDLVAAGYIKRVPTDPTTGRNDTWILQWSDDPKMPGIIDIRSGSIGRDRNLDGRTEPQQRLTGYPPSVYMQFFLACSSDTPCTRTDVFRVDRVPSGCCILTVTNGDGQGTDEARSYEVFLNDERVIPTDHSRNAQATVKLLQRNTLKVILSGAPHSKLFILIAYDHS
jgi:general secretion pathway protein G